MRGALTPALSQKGEGVNRGATEGATVETLNSSRGRETGFAGPQAQRHLGGQLLRVANSVGAYSIRLDPVVLHHLRPDINLLVDKHTS